MRKGFIFSIDAALALTVVMAMGIMLAVYFSASEPRMEAYDASRTIANDSAIVGSYLGKDATGMGLLSYIESGSDFGSCSSMYDYSQIVANDKQDGPVEKKYCKGI